MSQQLQVKMKLYRVLIASVFCFLSASPQADEKVLWLASDMPPCHYWVGDVTGYCDHIGELIFSQLPAVQFQKEPTSLNRRAALAAKGVHFCAVDILKSEERQNYLEFSDPIFPILPNGLIAIPGRLPEAIGDATGADIAKVIQSGLKLGVIKNRYYGPEIDRLMTELGSERVYQVTSENLLVSMLLKRRVNVILLNPVEIPIYEKQLNTELAYIALNDLKPLNIYASCTKGTKHSDLIRKINQIIAQQDKAQLRSFYRRALPEDARVVYDQLTAK